MNEALAILMAMALALPCAERLVTPSSVIGNAGMVAAIEAGASLSSPTDVPLLGTGEAVGGAALETAALAEGGQVAGLDAKKAGVPPLVVGSDVGIGTVLAMKAVGPAAFLQLDPLLTVVDMWDGGEIGELRKRANAAAAAGDEARYRECSARYWDRLGVAIERRKAFGGEAAAGPIRRLFGR